MHWTGVTSPAPFISEIRDDPVGPCNVSPPALSRQDFALIFALHNSFLLTRGSFCQRGYEGITQTLTLLREESACKIKTDSNV